MPVPFFFQEQTAEAFVQMEMRENDVIMSSLAKGGTTWVHKILHCLLHGVDEAGNKLPPVGIGATSQVYPDALVMERGAPCNPKTPPQADKMRKQFFGEWGFQDDMLGQPAPRLISTHLYGDNLPAGLVAPDGKGRLVIVLRNLKDTLASLHFFRGEPKDGWLGNEHGPGSLARFLDPDCPNAYGSCFDLVMASGATAEALAASGRVLVVYYEDLIRHLPSQVERLAAFLQVPCPAAKRDAVVETVSFSAMKQQGGLANVLLRKGGVGDWRNHLGRPSLPSSLVNLYPPHLADEIERTHASLYDTLLNGVYKAGINQLKGDSAAHQEHARAAYATLDALEIQLAKRRFLLGKTLTAADVRLCMTLLRFDASYRRGFHLDQAGGGILVGAAPGEPAGWPTLGAYLRDVYALLAPTVDWAAFRQYYRWAPGRLPMDAPLPDLERIIAAAQQKPRGRDKL